MKESDPPNRQIISVTLSPKFNDDWDKLQRALSVLVQQDQGMKAATQPTDRRVVISGMGELHLQIICGIPRCVFEMEEELYSDD